MRSAHWNIIVRKLEGSTEKHRDGDGGVGVWGWGGWWGEVWEIKCACSPAGHSRADGYGAQRGRDENIVECSGEKGSGCAIVCWYRDCIFLLVLFWSEWKAR